MTVSTDESSTGGSNPKATSELVARYYHELRRIALARVKDDPAAGSLNATALVHEVFLRLGGGEGDGEQKWADRNHFFAAAVEAMRRILVERARAGQRKKRGGEMERVDLAESAIIAPAEQEEILTVNEALEEFEKVYPEDAELVKMRFFVGYTLEEISEITGVSVRSLTRKWAFARAWLSDLIGELIDEQED